MNYFYKLYFLLLFSNIKTLADNSCQKQSDCNDQESIRCGICTESGTARVGQCIFPFPYYYKDGKSCSLVTECEENCNGHGSCDVGREGMFPSCRCEPQFYGWTCKHSTPSDLMGLIFPKYEVKLRGILKAIEHIQVISFYTCGTKESAVSVETFSDEGYYHKRNTNPAKCVDSTSPVYFFTEARFPYKHLSENDLRLSNEVLGYLSSYTYKITMNQVINFEISFPVFISYQNLNLVCVPVVKIIGCANFKFNENIFIRSNDLKISSSVSYIADGKYVSTSISKPECKENAKYKWKIWLNVNDDNQIPLLQYFDEKELKFEPFILNFGRYRVFLEVESLQQQPSKNFAYCYFKVIFIPLVAIIDGGSERIITKDHGLILSTTRSHDPNMSPDDQTHLQASWSCVDVSNTKLEICDPSKILPATNTYIVPSEKLSDGAVYKVTLTVWTTLYNNCSECGDVTPALAFVTVSVSNKTEEQQNYIYIQCMLNCNIKVVHNQQLYLRAKTGGQSKNTKYDFKWTYFEKGEAIEKDVKDIQENVTLPSSMLLVKKNALRSGKTYTIVVKVENLMWFAKYTFDTEEENFYGNCSITNTSGTRGLTLFSIYCYNYSSSFVYEFYDKTEEEALQEDVIFNGRMLGTSEVGELVDFRVTRGQVFVYVTDDSGLYTYHKFSVDLIPWDITDQIMNEMFINITEFLSDGDSARALEYVSAIPDIVPENVDKVELLDKLLTYTTHVQIEKLADIKLTTSTMNNVLATLNQDTQLSVDTELMRDTLEIVKNQTDLFNKIVGFGVDLKGMTPNEIKLVATLQLNCLSLTLLCKDPKTVGVTEFDYDLKTLHELVESSNYAEEAIFMVKDILTFSQAPGLPPTHITVTNDSLVMYVMENDEEYDLNKQLMNYANIPVDVPQKLLSELEVEMQENEESLALRVAILNDNIFWWSKSDVKSNLLSVSLAKRSKKETLDIITYVKNAIGMQINLNTTLNSTKITGIARSFDNETACTAEMDLRVEIHRLDPTPQSLIALRFLYPQTKGSLRVSILKDYRPDCTIVTRKGTIINEQSPYYPPLVIYQDEPKFYFVGIISDTNENTSYTLEVNTTVCQHWAAGHWSSQGCQIDPYNTKGSKAHCVCNHFSIFAAAFPVPPQEIDLFSDIKLFLTVFENPVVVAFVVVLLLLYLICCIWAFRKDKSDRLARNIIILEDNFPEDSYPYLLAVFTSSRFNAGTTAHVGIRIKGVSACSRSHILSCKYRKVLKRNFDDWFLIYCPEPLGELQSLHLWHDNAGSSPDWFCDKIVVYDLKQNEEIVFVIEEWLALRLTYYPEATVLPASVSQTRNVKRMFLDNCVLGLREGHGLLCIILRHPRSEISRLQRISVLMCCIIVSMLCSIMFYSSTVDDHQYSVGLREFYISIQSLVISLAVTFIVLFAFKRSYSYSYYKRKSSVMRKTSKADSERVDNTNKQKSVYSNFVRFVTKTLKGHPLVPAQLEGSAPVVKVRKVWLTIAWTLCIFVILTCSFFLMLYGLKLGLVKSKIWLSSVLFTLSEDFFVTTPAKIILYSIILSMVFQRMYEAENHQVNLKDVLEIEVPNDEKQLEKLLIIRRHPMYAPLLVEFRKEMIRKKELFNDWWTVIDFTVALCFIFVTSTVVSELWSSQYHANSHVRSIMTVSHHPLLGSQNFFDMKNIEQVNNFVQKSLFNGLYNTFWYNEIAPIKEMDVVREYWAEDFTHTLVGLQKLRQIRVVDVACKFTFLNTSRKCIPQLSKKTEDTDSYGIGWEPAQWHDTVKAYSPWNFTERSYSPYTTMYRLIGSSGEIYHSGGYSTHLGPTFKIASSTVAEMVDNVWQNQLTAAVFVELTLLNVNLNLFSQVTLIVEYLTAGSIQLKAQVVSVESKMNLTFWNALFIAFVIYYIIRSGYLINRIGLMEYLSSSSRNRSRLVVVFLGILTISFATIHYYLSGHYYKDFINRGLRDTYFDFDRFVYYFLSLQGILSLLLCVAIFRTLFIFRGGRIVLNYFYTFSISFTWIIWILLLATFFLWVQIPILILLNTFSFYSFVEVFLITKFTKYERTLDSGHNLAQISVFCKSLCLSVFMGFYVVVFKHYTKIAKSYKLKKSDQFNLIKFVFQQISRKRRSTR